MSTNNVPAPRDRAVLVLDDNPVNQKLVIRYLTAKGFRALGVSTTTEADEALAQELPGLILVDLSLPGEDGLSWVKRARDAQIVVPMIALTAHALPADRDRALAAGCQDFITKPIELKALLALAERYIGPRTPTPQVPPVPVP